MYYKGHQKKPVKLILYGPFKTSTSFYKQLLIHGNCLSTSAVTVKKSFLNINQLFFNESPEFRILEDYDLWLNIAKHNGKFFLINNFLGSYIISTDSISNDKSMIKRNRNIILKKHVFSNQNIEFKRSKLWNKANTRILLHDCLEFMKEKRYLKGLLYMLKISIKHPIFLSYLIIIRLHSKIIYRKLQIG